MEQIPTIEYYLKRLKSAIRQARCHERQYASEKFAPMVLTFTFVHVSISLFSVEV